MTALPRRVLERIGAVAKEAMRRRVWITVGAYIAISIGAIEISEAVREALLFPAWTSRLVTFLLILGLPIVVVLAWFFDVGEGGVTRTPPLEGSLSTGSGAGSVPNGSGSTRPAGGGARTAPGNRARPPRPALHMPDLRAATRSVEAPPDRDAERGEGETEPPDPERVKRAALGHVRHELRTPINAILGYSEMLLEEDPPKETAADLEKIRSGGRQLLARVDAILDAGRIEADAEKDLESYAGQIEADLRTPVTSVVGYCEMLIESESEAGRSTMVPDLERILGAAHALLEMSGDIVGVARRSESAARVADSSALASGVLAKLRPVASGDADGEGSLLVVDDNATNRELLTRQFARQGYVVATAENGKQALEQMRRQSFDLVLLDVIMPEMDGVETLRRIKVDERLRDTPVIMLSSLDEVDSAVRCLQLGAEEYLGKPIEGALLEARIRANLEIRRLRARDRAMRERLDADETLIEELLTSGIPAPMREQLRAGSVPIVESWPAAAVLCAVLDPVPFGAGAVDRYVSFLADAADEFDELADSIEGVDARLAGRPGFVAAAFESVDPGRALAAPLLELADDFLDALAAADPDAPGLFRLGIHAGPLIGSLFGASRPRLELWGEAIDTARAVAELAEPGATLVTPPAKALLGDAVHLDGIGVQEVNGRGSMRLYRIVRG